MGWRPYWLFYWLGDSSWLPIVSVILYGLMIVGGQRYFKDRKPWNMKTALKLWNLSLSIFSVCGFTRLLFPVIHMSLNYTMKENLCMNPFSHSGHNEAGVWGFLMIISKIFELVDTFFIIVHKKPLIFLHWYHHVSVLLYSWFSLVPHTAPAGVYFSLMNYFVHSVMYMYYFLMAAKMKPKWFNPIFITIGQILQMVVGVSLTAYGYFVSFTPGCHTTTINIIVAGCMYGSYFALFSKFFYDRYMGKSTTNMNPFAEKKKKVA